MDLQMIKLYNRIQSINPTYRPTVVQAQQKAKQRYTVILEWIKSCTSQEQLDKLFNYVFGFEYDVLGKRLRDFWSMYIWDLAGELQEAWKNKGEELIISKYLTKLEQLTH